MNHSSFISPLDWSTAACLYMAVCPFVYLSPSRNKKKKKKMMMEPLREMFFRGRYSFVVLFLFVMGTRKRVQYREGIEHNNIKLVVVGIERIIIIIKVTNHLRGASHETERHWHRTWLVSTISFFLLRPRRISSKTNVTSSSTATEHCWWLTEQQPTLLSHLWTKAAGGR